MEMLTTKMFSIRMLSVEIFSLDILLMQILVIRGCELLMISGFFLKWFTSTCNVRRSTNHNLSV